MLTALEAASLSYTAFSDWLLSVLESNFCIINTNAESSDFAPLLSLCRVRPAYASEKLA